jgi:uncharacterized membrane protein
LRQGDSHGLPAARALIGRRDFYAGGLMILFGLVMSLKGPTYGLGTLMHMGPGFMPTALGVILIFLGIAIAATAVTAYDPDEESIMPAQPQWVGWGCILAGPMCFILFGTYLGLAPATFTCVFVSALGDKKATLKSAFVLATVVMVFGTVLFAYFLQVPMPVLEWRGF